MTDSPSDADGQRGATDPEPVAGQPNPTPVDRPGPAWNTSGHVPPDYAPPAPGFVAGPPTAGPPGWGYAPSPGYGPPSGYPPPATPPSRPGRSKKGLVAIAAVALVAVLGVGVAVGIALSGDSSDEAVPASIPASPSEVPSTTTAPLSAPPGKYSMKAIANACDLIDPKPLTKWSSTPTPPVHREDRPSGGYGGGLTCDLRYTSTSPTDGVTTDEAGISVLAEFTSAGEPPEYDNFQNAGASQGWSTGTIPGLGARNYWRGLAVTDPAPAATYVVAVQDSNVSVQVQVAVHRAPGEPPLKLSDLSAIARTQTRTVLDRLKQP
jgi:hypothetical protein